MLSNTTKSQSKRILITPEQCMRTGKKIRKPVKILMQWFYKSSKTKQHQNLLCRNWTSNKIRSWNSDQTFNASKSQTWRRNPKSTTTSSSVASEDVEEAKRLEQQLLAKCRREREREKSYSGFSWEGLPSQSENTKAQLS